LLLAGTKAIRGTIDFRKNPASLPNDD